MPHAQPSIPRPEHPRPQMLRNQWINLNGLWSYEFDFAKSGRERGLCSSHGFTHSITVPFCPESVLSGVNHTDFIEAMFYHRTVQIPHEWRGRRVILHFGAVDYDCEVFLDGIRVGRHVGGSVSFEFEITKLVDDGDVHHLVLAVRDELRSRLQPGGKQSVAFQSAGCCYTRVTGIWQTVWMEAVGSCALLSCRVTPDFDDGSFLFQPLFLNGPQGKTFSVKILADGTPAGEGTCAVSDGASVSITLKRPRPWSPDDPFLYDIVYEILDDDARVIDHVESYAGLRKIHCENGQIYLNHQKLFLRMVLDQGYYPDGIWTAPSDDAIKQDIQLAMAAGFNGARLHQKVFEERFHYWADRLGYLTWGESASWGSYFSTAAEPVDSSEYWLSAFNFFAEWREIVLRDCNHPSIIAWTPLNETWGIQPLPRYRRVITELFDLTKSLDPLRPVNDCSGYHHIKTDLWTVHLYCPDAQQLKKALSPEHAPVHSMNEQSESPYNGQPYLNDEFGGFLFIPPNRRKFAKNTWGYHGLELKNEDELCAKIREQVDVMLEMPNLAGFCYTQLTDVEQEQNGLYNYDRTPKVSEGKLAGIFGKNKR